MLNKFINLFYEYSIIYPELLWNVRGKKMIFDNSSARLLRQHPDHVRLP